MPEKLDNYGRRKVLETIGIAGISFTGVGVTSAKKNNSNQDTISKGKARQIVEQKVEEVATRSDFSSWQDATIGEPILFHAKNSSKGPQYVPTAYVFTIQNEGKDVGYVTASARVDWAPILEYSKGTPPTRQIEQARLSAKEQENNPTGRLLYHGGVKYGLELDNGQIINVRDKLPSRIGKGINPESMSYNSPAIKQQWDYFEGSDDVGMTSSSDTDTLESVPAWTSHDDTGANITNYGPGKDLWAEWDGCTPIAGSMIIAYHEGYTESDTWEREYIIDHLHDSMETDDDSGETLPSNIDDGFDSYTEGSNDYNGRNIYNPDPEFTTREISDYSRPFLLNMTDGGSADDRNQSYGDHSVTVVGYNNSSTLLEYEIHDTWDDESHYLTKGSWSDYWYTRVTQS